MKVFFNKFILLIIFGSVIFSTGCDELNNLPLNIPVAFPFSTSGSSTALSDSATIRLSDVQEWRDNQDDIESVKYLSAAYYTESVSAGLKGDILVEVYNPLTNTVMLSETIKNVDPTKYINNAYVLGFSEAQIKLFDAYLSTLTSNNNDLSIKGRYKISSITGTTTPFQLTGRVEIVLETTVAL